MFDCVMFHGQIGRMRFLFFCLFFCTWAHCASLSGSPNIVLIVADDLGYGEAGCYGGTEIPTPNIDALARDGMRYTSAYVTAPNCSPSRAGFLTGRIPMRFGYEFNPIGHRNEQAGAGLPQAEKTIAELLQDGAGYATALIGKWHLCGTAEYHPQRHGFDEFFGFTHEGHYFVPSPYEGTTTMLRRKKLPNGVAGRWVSEDGRSILSDHMGHNEPDYDANNPIVRDGQPIVEETYLTDALTREAVDFIGRHKERPFFLYLAYNAVHSPLQGTDAWMEKFAGIEDVHRRIFAAMLGNLDAGIGEVLKKLADEGLEKETLVIFLSDNGGPTRELTSSNFPLRGEKGQMYEGGLRVPMILRWPGKLAAGKVVDTPVWSLDLLPTVCEAVAISIPKKTDGVSLLGQIPESRPFFWRQGNKAALRDGDFKIVRMKCEWELYDVRNDLSETANLAEKAPEKMQALKAKWEALNEEMAEPLFR